jgi:hypothetical protein
MSFIVQVAVASSGRELYKDCMKNNTHTALYPVTTLSYTERLSPRSCGGKTGEDFYDDVT